MSPFKLSEIACLSASNHRRILGIALVWLAAIISLAAMASLGPTNGDAKGYWYAVQTMRHHGDPYAEGYSSIKTYYSHPVHSAQDHKPTPYDYSPITVPVVKLFTYLPNWTLGPLYWCVLFAAFLLQLWGGYQMATKDEQRWIVWMLPLAPFFPCLLVEDVFLSGNLAYVLYGLVLAAAVAGFKQNKWFWFYVAVLVVSTCKAPMLTLICFPILAGRKQWLPACFTGVAGLGLFGVQALLWPLQFQEWMAELKIHFDMNRDFGFSPAGLLGYALVDMKLPYSPATTILYVVWVLALGALLLVALYTLVRNDEAQRQIWIPIAFVGTLLMNPRLMGYDVAALTIPLLLIAWRVLRLVMARSAQWSVGGIGSVAAVLPAKNENRPDFALILVALGWFVAFNFIAGSSVETWRYIALAVMLLMIALGLWMLYTLRRESPAS